MSESARESATKSQTDGGLLICTVRRAVSKFVHNAKSLARTLASSQWNVRIGFPVPTYLFQDCTKSCRVIPNSTEILVPYPLCTIAALGRKPHSRSCRAAILRERRWTLHISRG